MPEIPYSENRIQVSQAEFEAHADRVIVLQDEYRSGFECPTCLDKNKHTVAGREVSTIECDPCKGTGKRPKVGNDAILVRCEVCDGEGWIICPDCVGKGGTIVLAESTKGRPTTGTIVSVGNRAQDWKVGDKCIYPTFAGHAYDLIAVDVNGKPVPIILVVLRDSEILSHMYGTLEQNQVKRSAALHTAA